AWRLPRPHRAGRYRRHARNPLAARGGVTGRRRLMDITRTPLPDATSRWKALVDSAVRHVEGTDPWHVRGRVTGATGLVLEATGLRLAVGAGCRIQLSAGLDRWAEAEVVGFHGDTLYLMPQSDTTGLMPGAKVVPVETRAAGPLPLPRYAD